MIPAAIFTGLIFLLFGGASILLSALSIAFRVIFAVLTWLFLVLSFIAFWAFDRPKAAAMWKKAGA